LLRRTKPNLKVFFLDFPISRIQSRDLDLEKSPLWIVAAPAKGVSGGELVAQLIRSKTSPFQIVAPPNQNFTFQETTIQIVAPPNHKCFDCVSCFVHCGKVRELPILRAEGCGQRANKTTPRKRMMLGSVVHHVQDTGSACPYPRRVLMRTAYAAAAGPVCTSCTHLIALALCQAFYALPPPAPVSILVFAPLSSLPLPSSNHSFRLPIRAAT